MNVIPTYSSRFFVFGVTLLTVLPISVVFFSWFSPQQDIWQHLAQTQLGRLIANTFWLIVGVGFSVTVLGVGLAWLTTMCEFPGRKYFDWALMLPLAIPTYVLAFIFIGVFDYAGTFQSLLRDWFGENVRGFEVRNLSGVILVFTLALYPYVYLFSRNAFQKQGKSAIETAQVLGVSVKRAFFSVALPIARPAIMAGVALALMETLADFGAVSIFNYDTFTTAIYKAWYGFFSLEAAAQLASLLVLCVALILFFERISRRRKRYYFSTKRSQIDRFQLKTWHAMIATVFCFSILLFGFFIPIAQLIVWLFHSEGVVEINQQYIVLFEHTLLLAVGAALITVLVATIMAYTQRVYRSNAMGILVRTSTLGYALPGTVLAVGIIIIFAWFDQTVVALVSGWLNLEAKPLLVGSLLALLFAYLIRFQAVAFNPIESSLLVIRPHIHEVAKSLGAKNKRIIRKILLPLLSPGVFTAILLVFVEVMKELPATLLLRPFGWDTLAVRVYEMTSEGHWERAAFPALIIVLLGFIPIIIIAGRNNTTHVFHNNLSK